MNILYNFSVVTEVHGRTFGVWTLLTCTLCFLCAFNLENKPLYFATFLSFVYAFGHFLTEYLFYNTMAIANLTTVGIFAGRDVFPAWWLSYFKNCRLFLFGFSTMMVVETACRIARAYMIKPLCYVWSNLLHFHSNFLCFNYFRCKF